MTLASSGPRMAYGIYAAVCILVVTVLAYASAVTLSLESNARRSAELHERENRVRLAMYRMENVANPLLYTEIRREYWQYSPFHCANTEHVRFSSGEVLPQGTIVQPSPLLLSPPPEWIRLHFQVSAGGGWRSPEVLPERAREWPGFEEAFDAWDRSSYLLALYELGYTFTIDELAAEYAQAGGANAQFLEPLITTDQLKAVAASFEQRSSQSELHAQRQSQSDFGNRRWNAVSQQIHEPQLICEPEVVADFNLNAMSDEQFDGFAISDVEPSDANVNIAYLQMTPVWLQLPKRPTADLAFLRAVDVGGEIALQGFLIDWPVFQRMLLEPIKDLFPNATLTPVPTLDWMDEEPVLSSAPIKLATNEPLPATAAFVWTTTHTSLSIAWGATILLLTALGFGLHSLVEMSQRRSQFAYAVTHELRTPLTTFRLYTDMLAEGLVAEESRQEYLETLNTESRRLSDLVSRVLEFSRVESRQVKLTRREVEVSTLLQDIRTSYAERCAKAGARLDIDPGEAANLKLNTDPQFVQQILGNLIDNACKYGLPDGAAPEAPAPISLRVQTQSGQICFDVEDSGPGVPATCRAHIFKPYRRAAKDAAHTTGGVGLGLALSRNWAKLLDGKLELLEPRTGNGARFRLSLPS